MKFKHDQEIVVSSIDNAIEIIKILSKEDYCVMLYAEDNLYIIKYLEVYYDD